MGRTAPMNRLLQGDVGSGKTLVAAAAIVLAARAGAQSALMAPTEILAVQHARKLAPLLLPFGIRGRGVSLGSPGCARTCAGRAGISIWRAANASLAVGTHALLDGKCGSSRGWGLVDHRRTASSSASSSARKLRAKSGAPHTLYMTATPIPRTLAQTKYADLDLSIIDELPPGRTPIETFVIRASRRASGLRGSSADQRRLGGGKPTSLRPRSKKPATNLGARRALLGGGRAPRADHALESSPTCGSRCCTERCRRGRKMR